MWVQGVTTRTRRVAAASVSEGVFSRRNRSARTVDRVGVTMVALDVEGLTREIDAVRDVVVVPGARGETTTTTSTAERAGSDDVGRIEAALAGHEGTWHLRVNRLERGKLVAWYAVVYSRPVPVRAQPHIDSAVLGFAAPSARVLGVSLTSDGWLELAGDDASGENVNGSAGWMLTNHPEHGTLLAHASGCELPPTTMRLASAEAVIDVDHTALPLRNEGYLYRVAHGPFVPVRASASVKSEIIGRMHEDRLVRARARRGDWIELCEDGVAGWMLTLHPEFGRLLKRCNADGSDIIHATSE